MKLSWPVAAITIVLTITLVFVLYSVNVDPRHKGSSQLRGPNENITEGIEVIAPLELGNTQETEWTITNEKHEVANKLGALPINVVVLGIDTSEKIALLESDSEVLKYQVGDFIFKQPIQLINVKESVATFIFDNKKFDINLYDANFLAKENESVDSTFSNMNSNQIGTRPKLLEHIIDMSTMQHSQGGFYALPGISRKLFNQAGLLEGDTINKINDVDITDLAAIKALSQQIKALDTIKFEVQREGKQVTLYLDIPSEDLSLRK